jgi:hypothetical protein
MNFQPVEGGGLPPVHLDDILYLSLFKPSGNTQRNKIGGSISKVFNGWSIQMVVVIVADQDSVDRRELFEGDPRRYNPFNP